jgi:hypothetical protein
LGRSFEREIHRDIQDIQDKENQKAEDRKQKAEGRKVEAIAPAIKWL